MVQKFSVVAFTTAGKLFIGEETRQASNELKIAHQKQVYYETEGSEEDKAAIASNFEKP